MKYPYRYISIIPYLLLIIFIISGCSSLPIDPSPVPSYKIDPTESNSFKTIFSPVFKQDSEQSGFFILNDNETAFMSRVALVGLAENSLDLQYYIWRRDKTGALLMDRILKAADRGVRIRLLIDDTTSWDKDEGLALINAHNNIQIKIYNPLGGRFSGSGLRSLALIGNFRRINHRMHNKMFVADNQAAIVGGRNIGDEYFGANERFNVRDMDLLAVGPVVDDISKAFDEYWNSEWAIRLELVIHNVPSDKKAEKIWKKFQQHISNLHDFPYAIDLTREELFTRVSSYPPRLIMSDAKVLYDPPRKDLKSEEYGMVYLLRELTKDTQNEIIIAAPYLIPTEKMLQKLGELNNKGVAVKILTNSMKANDVTMAQYAYASKRRKMLKAGAQLFELRSDAIDRENYMAPPYRASKLGLHAKVAVYDRKILLVGSLNLDPRSISINTEMGLLIYSAELANQVSEMLEEDMHPRNSYQALLRKEPRKSKIKSPRKMNRKMDDGVTYDYDLIWRTEEHGKVVIHEAEPNAGFWKKLGSLIYTFLPIENQL